MDTTQHETTRTGQHAPTIWASVRSELQARRAARAAQRQLEQELATYTTPGEIDDLLAALDRHESPQVEQMRLILSRNLQAYYRTLPLAS
jgi:predicted MarR family transcription regulator